MGKPVTQPYRRGVPERQFSVHNETIYFSHDVRQEEVIIRIMSKAYASPYFKIEKEVAKIYLNNLSWSKNEMQTRPRDCSGPSIHLQNMYNLDVLKEVRIITKHAANLGHVCSPEAEQKLVAYITAGIPACSISCQPSSMRFSTRKKGVPKTRRYTRSDSEDNGIRDAKRQRRLLGSISGAKTRQVRPTLTRCG